MLMLSENSKTLTSFIKAPVPIYMQIYLFNVTNPDAIRFHGAKPILKEVGPYTYREVREKFDLVWGHDDGSVSYQQNFTFFFDEEMSNGLKETDYITTINAVMVVASQVFGNETNPILRTVWSQLEKEMDLFESHVVRELLFEGYPLPEFDFDFSEVLPQLNFTEGWSGTIYEILEAMGVPDIPEFLQDNKMCLMYGVSYWLKCVRVP
ncbi:hypothetical protein OTU49_007814 [Cherax quadricarinatus]|uniref:Scavenger receptor class B member 1 n=1 Tax=Cherax quadricarinatus TaxID=27406 RepID=A0AAW0WUP4_CHEQU